MSIASLKFLIYSDVATTRETPPMSLTSDAAPAVMERPKAVPPPREKFSTEIWNLPNSLTLFRIFLVPILVVVLRSEEHTSELQSRVDLVCRLLLEKKKKRRQATLRENRRQQIE